MGSLDYIHIPPIILKIKGLSLREKLLLALVISFEDKCLHCGNAELAELLNVERHRPSDLLSSLEHKGFIEIVNRQSRHRKIYFRRNAQVEGILLPTKVASKGSLLASLLPPTSGESRNITKELKEEEEGEAYQLSFVSYWNSKDNLPKVRNLTNDRKAKLRARLKEPDFADNWREIIDRISQSAFCTGTNDRGWKADIDWLLKNSTNYTKVLEGKYGNQPTTDNQTSIIKFEGPGPTSEYYQSKLDELMRIPEAKRSAKDEEEICHYRKLLG